MAPCHTHAGCVSAESHDVDNPCHIAHIDTETRYVASPSIVTPDPLSVASSDKCSSSEDSWVKLCTVTMSLEARGRRKTRDVSFSGKKTNVRDTTLCVRENTINNCCRKIWERDKNCV